ncbi:MAG TPA: hypothetical protein VKI99_13660 [Candidatus Dormibacteraeota bacterium]|nr:hypothetical protein [Candidatus Dormibacteraeota bacterium]
MVDRTPDPAPERVQLLRAWASQLLVLDGGAQLRIAGSQRPEPLGQGFDAGPAEIVVHLACLEGVEVAIECLFRPPDLGLDGSQLLPLIRPRGAGPCKVPLDRLLQHPLVLIRMQRRLQHGFVQSGHIDPLGGAGVAAVALTRVVGVVAVAVDLALGSGTEVVMAAGRAHDQAAQEVIGRIGPPPGVIFATLVE